MSRPYWPPFCGALFEGQVAGAPLVCDQDPHGPGARHKNEETGFEWRSNQGYPRTAPVPAKED